MCGICGLVGKNWSWSDAGLVGLVQSDSFAGAVVTHESGARTSMTPAEAARLSEDLSISPTMTFHRIENAFDLMIELDGAQAASNGAPRNQDAYGAIPPVRDGGIFGDGVGDGVGFGNDPLDIYPVNPLDLFPDGGLIGAGPDDYPDNDTTTGVLVVDGPQQFVTQEVPLDEDWMAVELVAGQKYEINQHFTTDGPNGVGQPDAFLNLYDSTGMFITSADGGANTTYNNGNSGFDVTLTYTATYTGTHYVGFTAYSETGTGPGETVGDSVVFVEDVTNDPTAYTPYYDIDSPLHSIDWGSEFDGSSRNPDGDEGPRPTGNEFTGYASNRYGVEGKTVITYYFSRTGDAYTSEDGAGLETTLQARDMEQWEKDAFRLSFDLYEEVADIVYVEVENRFEADIKIILYEGTPGPGASLLGRMSPPDEKNEGQTEINSGDSRWTEEGVSQGGFYFPTILHELGHGHGLAHPHDNGGRSSVMRGAGNDGGVIGGGLGDFDLSQQVFTIMSYNDGWASSPYGTPSGSATSPDQFGWMGTLAPLDIAVIQDKYGVNEDTRTGDDTYTIQDFNGAGNFYSAIWDAGGTDEIVYIGEADSYIDLRAATLEYEEGGGGRVSYAFGIHGGFIIANGVTIENGAADLGNDTVIGNAVANELSGGAGDDSLIGFAGDDTLLGGAGADSLFAGSGDDSALGGDGGDFIRAGGGADTLRGGEGDDFLGASNFHDRSFGDAGNDTMLGGSGRDTMNGGEGDDQMLGAVGADVLNGGAGNDRLRGMDNHDTLTGGAGDDTFIFRSSEDVAGADQDVITDFAAGAGSEDVVQLIGYSGFSTFADVLAAASDVGGDAVIALGGGAALTLQGVAVADLHSDDFIFG